MPKAQLTRLKEADRPTINFRIDGAPATALEGDTVLTAILTNAARLRISEFGDGPRAGFCLMGACQDCWVNLASGGRLRACTSYVEEGMEIATSGPVT